MFKIKETFVKEFEDYYNKTIRNVSKREYTYSQHLICPEHGQ